MTFLETYNTSFSSSAPVLRVIYLKFDQPETICDRAKMNLAGHHVQGLSGNFCEPCSQSYFAILKVGKHSEK